MAPNLGSVILANAGQAYSLDQLIVNTFKGIVRRPENGFIAQFVAIQNDVNNGSAKLAIGNSQVSFTNAGVVIFSTQVWPIYSMDSNLINLAHVFLYTDTSGIQANLAWLTR